jgi:hypothetical protein
VWLRRTSEFSFSGHGESAAAAVSEQAAETTVSIEALNYANLAAHEDRAERERGGGNEQFGHEVAPFSGRDRLRTRKTTRT